MLLSNTPVFTVLPVADLDKSVKFYIDKLGLKKMGNMEGAGGMALEAGNGTGVFLYERGPVKSDFTQAGFKVDDLEKTMAELREKGVAFEEYDTPELKTVNGVANMGPNKSAWFKDPDGNIIALNQMA